MKSITQKLSWLDAKLVVADALESQIARIQALQGLGTTENNDSCRVKQLTSYAGYRIVLSPINKEKKNGYDSRDYIAQ